MKNKTTLNFFWDKEDNFTEYTYNNQDFYQYNLERFRYLVVSCDYIDENPFCGCVDVDTLEIVNQEAFDRLSSMDYDDLNDMKDEHDWDWIGDDFEHMGEYFNFVCSHLGTHTYSTEVMGDCEYLAVDMWEIPKQYLGNPTAKRAYLEGVSDSENSFVRDW